MSYALYTPSLIHSAMIYWGNITRHRARSKVKTVFQRMVFIYHKDYLDNWNLITGKSAFLYWADSGEFEKTFSTNQTHDKIIMLQNVTWYSHKRTYTNKSHGISIQMSIHSITYARLCQAFNYISVLHNAKIIFERIILLVTSSDNIRRMGKYLLSPVCMPILANATNVSEAVWDIKRI